LTYVLLKFAQIQYGLFNFENRCQTLPYYRHFPEIRWGLKYIFRILGIPLFKDSSTLWNRAFSAIWLIYLEKKLIRPVSRTPDTDCGSVPDSPWRTGGGL